jgi:hypothetical protein
MEQLQNFINGKSVPSSSGEVTQLINPATGEVYATAPKSNAADVDAAIPEDGLPEVSGEPVSGFICTSALAHLDKELGVCGVSHGLTIKRSG